MSQFNGQGKRKALAVCAISYSVEQLAKALAELIRTLRRYGYPSRSAAEPIYWRFINVDPWQER